MLSPLKFEPLFKYRMWGGEKLKTILNKNYSEQSIGESWEISDVKGEQTLVKEGPHVGKTLEELIGEFKERLLGRSVYEAYGNEFPLLIKFIDAKTPLSIQVHPGDELARARHGCFGKNEMWYVMQADDEAEMILGFNADLNKSSFQEHLVNGTIHDFLHHESVKKGDTFHIPTGRVHAIGAGILLAEIQQTSDVTYRIYDYDRVDKQTGKKRELHIDLALDVIDFERKESYKTDYQLTPNASNKLLHTPYFKSNILEVSGSVNRNLSTIDSFIIYMCVEGEVVLKHADTSYSLTKGECILIPAEINEIHFSGEHGVCLEVFI